MGSSRDRLIGAERVPGNADISRDRHGNSFAWGRLAGPTLPPLSTLLALLASALPLPFCFLASIRTGFYFGCGDGIIFVGRQLAGGGGMGLAFAVLFPGFDLDIFDFRASSGFCLLPTICWRSRNSVCPCRLVS